MSPIVYLGLGTNLGDRLQNLKDAAASLPETVRLLRSSPVYETPPWGYKDQPDFLNQVIEVETGLSPLELLGELKSIEARLGRKQTFQYGPRQIDLDILFYGRQVVDLPGLQVPHPHLAERAFVLVPLAELAPAFRHPVLMRTVREMLESVKTKGIKRYKGDKQK